MNQELRTIHDLIFALWGIQDQAWQKNEGPFAPQVSHLKTFNSLESILTLSQYASREELEKNLQSLDDGRFDTGKRSLLLPPVLNTSGFVPLLSMKLDTTSDERSVSIEIRMFTCWEEGLKCLPLRFESGTGIHCFFHAQLGTHDVVLPLPWLDTSQPSFPLPAGCPCTLLISALLSIYGPEMLNHVVPNDSAIHKIKDCLDRTISLRQILAG